MYWAAMVMKPAKALESWTEPQPPTNQGKTQHTNPSPKEKGQK